MTTALIHGDPGSYKTATLMSDYLVPAVKAGRVVVTNIRGVKSVEEISELYKFPLPETAEIITVEFNQAGFDLMARFFHWAPLGALILMDEGQRVYPTRLRNFQQYDNPNLEDIRPKTVEDAFDSHRHMNWDIYISTPNISKVHKEIRAVAEYGFRHKNLGTVFSFMKLYYKRTVHNAENSGAAIGNTISSTIKKIDVRVFHAYQSTATGQTKEASTSFSILKQPKVILLLLVIGYSVWNMGNIFSDPGGVPVYFGGTPKTSSSPVVNPNPSLPVSAPAGVSGGNGDIRPNNSNGSNPFLDAAVYFVGEFNNATYFEVEFKDKSVLTFNQWELENIGFVIAKFNQSVFKFTFGTQNFYVFQKPMLYTETQLADHQPEVSALN